MPQEAHLDYYRILQVQPEAEQEVIQGAYYRLVRKYHPDVLAPGQRDAPEVLQKIQEINEAYAVLGDPEKRAEYDRRWKAHDQDRKQSEGTSLLVRSAAPRPIEKRRESPFERLVYEVKCARTRRRFYMLLARPKGSGSLFRVVGFQPITESGLFRDPEAPQPRGPQPPILATSPGASSELRMDFPSEEELKALLEQSPSLDMGAVDWRGSQCPDCGSYIRVQGTLLFWCTCGNCAGLFCAGGLRKILIAVIAACPRCGVKGRLTGLARSGQQSTLSIQGGQPSSQLEERSSGPQLPKAQDSHLLKPAARDRKK